MNADMPIEVGKKALTISINQILSGENKTAEELAAEDEESLEGKPQDPFTEEQILAKWNEFANSIKEDNLSFYTTLTKRPPVLKENWTLELSIDNKVQEHALQKEKSLLLGFIRRELNNYAIQLQHVMNETTDDAHLYTPIDKFKRMAEKNPNLITLQKTFNLDIDY